MFDDFDGGLIECALANLTWLCVQRFPCLSIPKHMNGVSLFNILAPRNCMDFSMEEHLVFLIDSFGVHRLQWMRFDVAVASNGQHPSPLVVNDRGNNFLLMSPSSSQSQPHR